MAETDHAVHTSRITVVTRGAEGVLAQIKAQLGKIVQVRRVYEVGGDARWVERELALVKVRGAGEARVETLRIAEIFRARVIDTGTDSFVFELTGAPRQDRQVRDPDASAGPGGGVAHRRALHRPRGGAGMMGVYLPSPLRGEGQGWGWRRRRTKAGGRRPRSPCQNAMLPPPSPTLPPSRGKGD